MRVQLFTPLYISPRDQDEDGQRHALGTDEDERHEDADDMVASRENANGGERAGADPAALEADIARI
jgi:hypothetical protein